MAPCLAIDIGSTWTKGARFDWSGDELVLRRRASHPTTVADLAEGFAAVLDALLPEESIGDTCDRIARGEIELHYSSSAKGGLAVAALGLVPDITLESAKMAAYSAGARLTQVLSYRLTPSDIRALEAAPPDILLFAGGTDGGNTGYVLANAQALAASSLTCAMVYAGNRSVRDEVCARLAGKSLVAVDNLLPALDSPHPEPAREAIRALFLERIVKGKGLDRVVALARGEPAPTPYAMFEFTRSIREHVPGWDEFLLLDIGGATTDVYSAHREMPSAGVVLRGLPEPDVKRTVEGDLGMRVSARATLDAGRRAIADRLGANAHALAALQRYADDITAAPEHIPRDRDARQLDTLLAGICLSEACARHAGRSHEVSTPDGLVQLQVGRDLSDVTRVIGSGGWLAHAQDFDPLPWLRSRHLDERGRTVLLPRRVEYFRDADYVFPLLANVARRHPAAAARAAVRSLRIATSLDSHGTHQPAPVA
ncbi:MAG TPA: glutamate mutase L [Ramlibacter sp.]|uniref:glutamate mutase L n=1 Tax=Ramlibacter sp. TaxID=1917967 RepID=UPI002C1A01DA|nr:glutamate mutase L [Ramlibacter sp.]HVZ44830.1 glutamate mutase L [Ramlibacter sp.]